MDLQPELGKTPFNTLATAFGVFSVLFALSSYVLDSLYMAEPLPATLFGIVISQAGWAPFEKLAAQSQLTSDLTRIVLAIQLFLAGVQLPAKYLQNTGFSLFMLLVPVMTIMWLVSGVCVFVVTPRSINFLHALIIAACVTPTDPVLCASIVKGRFAAAHVSKRLQDLILAESGANDGFGYPFLFLALSIYRYSGPEIAAHWLVDTVCYQILLGIALGAFIGYGGQLLITTLRERDQIDDTAYYFVALGMPLLIMGVGGLVGTDDLLACFVAGNLFTWNDEYRKQTETDSFQMVLDMVLNLAIFVWIGATVPWQAMVQIMPLWRFIIIALCMVALRRVPAVMALYRLIPAVKGWQEALFLGYFGPIGVGALFYLQVLGQALASFDNAQNAVIMEFAAPIVYLSIIACVVLHGLSIPLFKLVLVYSRR